MGIRVFWIQSLQPQDPGLHVVVLIAFDADGRWRPARQNFPGGAPSPIFSATRNRPSGSCNCLFRSLFRSANRDRVAADDVVLIDQIENLRGNMDPDLHCASEPIECAPYFMSKNLHVAIVGATGAVGVEMIKTLEKRNFPVGDSLCSPPPARRENLPSAEPSRHQGIARGLICRGGRRSVQRRLGISVKFAPIAVKAGAVVVDNSTPSAWTPTCRL